MIAALAYGRVAPVLGQQKVPEATFNQLRLSGESQMKRSWTAALAATLFACVFLAPTTALAAAAKCSDPKVYLLYLQGRLIEEIAGECDLDSDAVKMIVEKQKAKRARERATGGVPPQQLPRQAYCCDGARNSRCPIVAGSTQLGDTCFCPGQGYGFICR